MFNLQHVSQDPHLFASQHYSLITVYDDNLFIRNDYDMLTPSQRNYIVKFALQAQFKQVKGTLLQRGDEKLHMPRPASSLACSTFQSKYLARDPKQWYAITPTGYAECVFYDMENIGVDEGVARLINLIQKCPFNIEWLRDISYGSPIEEVTRYCYTALTGYQKDIIASRFKHKKYLK